MIKPGMFISDRYEIIDKVGSGGMADVYKAKCHRLNRFVAIKVLKPEFSSDRSFVNKFRGEAQSAAGLSHPNIVNVYDVGDDNGLHYIVMELVEGITLKRFIERKGKLEVKEAIGISIQIAQGMEAAHANHIIHRDIKPQNIIISKEGKVKVTDFGIAKATTSNTITSNAMGSVHYLSPEQARGGYSDEKSDIYSLGVTMYEMLAGQVPFVGDTSVSVALAHIQGEPVPLRQINPNIPHGVDMIVKKCMQKKPERRYLSASELIIDLKKAIANPDGDFVKLVSPMVTDSPTINLTNAELEQIKNSTVMNNPETDVKSQSNQVNNNFDDDDDEDIDAVDPRTAKLLIGFAIPVGIAVIVLIIYIASKIFSGFGSLGDNNNKTELPESTNEITEEVLPTEEITTESEIVLPSLVGLTFDQAAEKMRAYGEFRITQKESYSDTLESGLIISQLPESGTSVKEGSEIVVTVSVGSEEFELEDFANMRDEDVTKKLEGLGLVVSHDYDYNDTVEEGYVVSTTPAAHSFVKKGDSIKVLVSKGPENKETEVPLLVGLSRQAAEDALKSANLKVGKVTKGSSDQYEAGIVKYQNYSQGEKVKEGTAVDFTISTGPEATPEPTPTPDPSQEPETKPTEDVKPDEPTEPTKYVGSVTIDVNPVEGDEPAEIILDLYQDGVSRVIYEDVVYASDFPLTVNGIEGTSENDGKITMYVNDEMYDTKTWKVKFTAQ